MRSRVLGIRRGDTGADLSFLLEGEDFSFLVFLALKIVDKEVMVGGNFFRLIFARLDLLLLLPNILCSQVTKP